VFGKDLDDLLGEAIFLADVREWPNHGAMEKNGTCCRVSWSERFNSPIEASSQLIEVTGSSSAVHEYIPDYRVHRSAIANVQDRVRGTALTILHIFKKQATLVAPRQQLADPDRVYSPGEEPPKWPNPDP
jgi:hypothetical protein